MTTACLELRFVSSRIEEAMSMLQKILIDTRSFPGSEGVEVLVDVADPSRVLVIERWATPEDDAAYRAWRSGDGRTGLSELLSEPARLVQFRAVQTL